MLHRSVRPAVLFLLPMLLTACVGPPAPDAELCRDVIARLCGARVCSTVQARLTPPDTGCEQELERRSGCDDAAFEFTSPTRARVLECRLPLVRESDDRAAIPSCDFVDESLRVCPDLVSLLGGKP